MTNLRRDEKRKSQTFPFTRREEDPERENEWTSKDSLIAKARVAAEMEVILLTRRERFDEELPANLRRQKVRGGVFKEGEKKSVWGQKGEKRDSNVCSRSDGLQPMPRPLQGRKRGQFSHHS